MKNTKGIACKVNNYHITAIAVKDGAPVSITFDAEARDARVAKKFAAYKLGVKASQVLVSFELEKREFIINCGYDTLMNALADANIEVAFNDASDKDTDE